MSACWISVHDYEQRSLVLAPQETRTDGMLMHPAYDRLSQQHRWRPQGAQHLRKERLHMRPGSTTYAPAIYRAAMSEPRKRTEMSHQDGCKDLRSAPDACHLRS